MLRRILALVLVPFLAFAQTADPNKGGPPGRPGITGGTVASVAGKTGDVTLTKSDVGLSSVANGLQILNSGSAVSIQAGTHAARPAAGTAGGPIYIETDTGAIFRDNATTWAQIGNITSGMVSGLAASATTDATVASNINYTSAGTGAVPVTIDKTIAKFTPEMFGAVADGVTDDSTAVNAAAAAALLGASGNAPFDRTGGVLVFNPGKTYYCASGVTIKCNTYGVGALLLFPRDDVFTGTAVTLGAAAEILEGKTIWLPMVKTTKTSYANWNLAPNSCGVKVYAAQYSEIHLTGARNFAYGVWLTAKTGQGWNGYNDYYFTMMLDNKVQLRLEAEDVAADAWINENRFHGGRFSHSSSFGTTVADVRALLIKQAATAGGAISTTKTLTLTQSTRVISGSAGDFSGCYVGGHVVMGGWANSASNGNFRVSAVAADTSSITIASTYTLGANETSRANVTIAMEGTPFGSIPDNNSFIGMSLESEAAEAMIEIRGGTLNNFTDVRFEKTAGAYIYLFGMSSGTAPCLANVFSGGYTNSAANLQPTTNAWATGNSIFMARRLALSSTDANGSAHFYNNGSDTYGDITIWPNAVGDAGIFNPSGSGFLAQMGGYYLKYKSAANTQPTVQLAGNGIAGNATVFQLGDGSTAIGMGFNAVSGNQGWCEVPAGNTAGGFAHMDKQVVSGALSGATTVITMSIPTGARLQAVQMRVDTLITSGAGTTWSAAFSGGSTTAIGAGSYAFTKSTKVQTCLTPEITTNTTNITLTCNGGTFTAGVVQAVVYYDYFVTMAAAP